MSRRSIQKVAPRSHTKMMSCPRIDWDPGRVEVAVDQHLSASGGLQYAAAALDCLQGDVAAEGIGFNLGDGGVFGLFIDAQADVLQGAIARPESGVRWNRGIAEEAVGGCGKRCRQELDNGLFVVAGRTPRAFRN